MIKLPYGVSNFQKLSTNNLYYVDRTSYIETLEQLGDNVILFIRPRRFGKSLFVSMLQYYYGMEYRGDFEDIFGKYYIGQHPTPLANQYLVMHLDFSGIDTSEPKFIKRDFLYSVRESALNFMATYEEYFDEEDIEEVKSFTAPNNLIRTLFNKTRRRVKNKKVYLVIDEYDHFTNELLSFDFSQFSRIVGRNGWVRKFYEVLKTANGQGTVDRMFITGISPITLDNLTSGFNIASNFSTDLLLNEMMGFKELEVVDILTTIGVPENELDKVLSDLRHWYDGYLFNIRGKHRIYNPDMVLYFAKHYLWYQMYPDDLLDENIASDYGKMRKMFQINDTERANLEVLKMIIEKGRIEANLTKRYSFDLPWRRQDFISLLFYLGILTMDKAGLNPSFRMPNYVIRQLYFQFFHQLTLESADLHPDAVDITGKVKALAQQNDLQPIIDLTEEILAQMAVEDRAHFNEISLKSIFTSFFYQVRYFNIFSELGVEKRDKERGRVDLVLLRRPPFVPTYQFAFELKYLREKQRTQFDRVKKEAFTQMEAYLQHDKRLKSLENLKAYVIIFVVNKGFVFPV